MSARSIRRAAERLAMKPGRKAADPAARFSPTAVAPAFEPVAALVPEPSQARLAANRANAQLSTGPRTSQGKAISSLNAIKTGLTGRTVVLSSDDAAQYQRHTVAYENEFKPVGAFECDLVQSIVDSIWRLQRIVCLEQNLFSKGHIEFDELFAAADPAQRSALIELHTYQTYEKQFRNLHVQEARLARRREKEIAELRQLQRERVQEHQAALKEAAGLYLAAQHAGKDWNPAQHGFEFSIDTIKTFLENVRTVHTAQESIRKECSRSKAA